MLGYKLYGYASQDKQIHSEHNKAHSREACSRVSSMASLASKGRNESLPVGYLMAWAVKLCQQASWSEVPGGKKLIPPQSVFISPDMSLLWKRDYIFQVFSNPQIPYWNFFHVDVWGHWDNNELSTLTASTRRFMLFYDWTILLDLHMKQTKTPFATSKIM